MPTEAVYRRLWIGMLLTAAAASLVLGESSVNALFPRSTDLERHALARLGTTAPRPIIFLGSSAVTGAYVSPNRSISEVFGARLVGESAYNLAWGGANLLATLACFRLALPYRPRLALMAVDETDLLFRQSHSRILLRRVELVRDAVPPPFFNAVAAYAEAPPGPLDFLRRPLQAPLSRVKFETMRRIADLRARFYGPSSSHGPPSGARLLIPPEAVDSIFDAFKRDAERAGTAYVVFLPPQPPDVLAWTGEYRRSMKELLIRKRILCIDYTSLFADRPGVFIDDRHLTVEGHALLAERLYRDVAALLPTVLKR